MTQAQYSDFMEAIVPPYVAERAAADHVSAEVAERYARHSTRGSCPRAIARPAIVSYGSFDRRR